MSHRGLALLVAAAAAATIAAALAFLLLGGEPGSEDPIPRRLQAEGTLAPRIVLFGDTVRAHVDVTLDRRRVDPDSVKVRASFKEWRRVEPSRIERSDAGSTTYLQVAYVLRCLKQNCPPERDLRPFEFDPATVSFTDRHDGRQKQETVEVFWPRLIVNTRIGPGDLAVAGSPWRADIASVPKPSYRAAPRLLISLLSVAALVLALTGVALTWFGWPRKQPAPVPAAPAEPEFLLTPLEQALELLEDAARANGAADQRRSLELVAEVLAQRGDEDGLAPAARELAWSPTAPPPEATKGLAVRVRTKLEEELRTLEAERRRLEAEAAAVAAAEEARVRRA